MPDRKQQPYQSPVEVLSSALAGFYMPSLGTEQAGKVAVMPLDNAVSGRTERRLPIILVVNVVPLDGAGGQRAQRTYTDNVSPHGMRINSAFAWTPGEQAEITPVKGGGAPMRGRVVYCQKLDDGRFFIGLHFPQDAIPWPILKRFDGVALTLGGDWNFAGPRMDLVKKPY